MQVVEHDLGNTELITGVEDDAHGSVRVYIGRRDRGVHFIVADPQDAQGVREAFRVAFGRRSDSLRLAVLKTQIPYGLLLSDADD